MNSTTFFPATLKALPIWVLWKLEERNGRRTKVPYQVNGRRASATDPATWTTYQEIIQAGKNSHGLYRGVGTVMSKQYRTIFIDIDHCIDPLKGVFNERAEDILEAFMDDDGNLTTFAEISQSGTGLHLIVIGDIPRSFKNSRQGVEMYDNGRFIAMTGRVVSACEPTECTNGINYVFERYKTASKASDWTSRPIDPATRREDDWIIRHASGREGSKFSALFQGDWSAYSSRSEADIALCCLLAFWTNNDPEAISRLFRRSGLYRAKWDRDSYRQPTIERAISHNDDTLFEWQRKHTKERGAASLEWLDTVYH